MRTITEIKIESGIKYLNESSQFNSLPTNCLFDKGKVGCGGTTLAIESNEPYVIAVPFVTLVENKYLQHPNIFPVYEGVLINDIKEYVANSENPIIITTYDGLKKVSKAVDTSKFKLLVDELHLLFLQYSFREEAVSNVLNLYKNYKEYCFMTATILDEEFILDELSELPIVKAVWEDVDEVTVVSTKCVKGVANTAVDIINYHLNGQEEGNLYMFVNSVNFIKDLVRVAELTEENCNVIYSKGNKTDVGISRGQLPSLKDGSIKPKKINLLTSTVFEGTDIYDIDGKIVIVSDASKAHTLVDISTSFQQIAGRIRNSKYINSIVHLYTNTRYNNVSYDEFLVRSNKEIEDSKSVAQEYNNLSETAKSMMQVKPNETYISTENNMFKFNPNLVKVDLYNFKVTKCLYKIRVNNLNKEYKKYNYNVTNYVHSSNVVISPADLENFQTVVENIKLFYANFVAFYTQEQTAYLEAAYLRFPFLKEAIKKIGFEGIEAEGYVQTNIKRKLTSLLDINIETKIFKLIKSYDDITIGNFIPSNVLKNRFNSIYKYLGLSIKGKGSDISKYFHIEPKQKKIDNKNVEGFIILNPKMFIK